MTNIEIYDAIGSEGMELVIFSDTEMEIVPEGSSYFEKTVLRKIPLDKWYWRDTLIDNHLYDEKIDEPKEASDEEKELFVTEQLLSDLEWELEMIRRSSND